MNAFLQNLSPYARVALDHPLFKLESPRVRRLLHPRQLLKLSFRVIYIIFVILFFFWILAANADDQRLNLYRTSVDQLLLLIVIASIGLEGILDFACMVATANSFAGEFVAGRWNLLQLTPLMPEDIAAVKHVAVRLRVWRMTVVVFGLHVAVIILGILTWWFFDGLSYFQFQLEETPAYVAILVVGATYLVEPLWRVRAVTALGLAISFRVRNPVSTSLAAIGAVLGLWILQPLIIIGVFWIAGTVLIPVVISIPDLSVGFILLLLVALYFTGMIYGFYAVVKNIALRRLVRWMNRTEA